MTTYTWKLVLSQRYTQRYAHKDKQPKPPSIAPAARVIVRITNYGMPHALKIVNESVPFDADFNTIVKYSEELKDMGYRVVKVEPPLKRR